MTPLPILYSFRRCPYAMRARMALLASGQEVELREIILRAKPQAMLDASPKGTVPVLVLANGQVIAESLEIMRWALAARDPEDWLAGDDAALIAANDGPFKHHLDRYKYPSRYPGDSGDHRAGVLNIWKRWRRGWPISPICAGTSARWPISRCSRSCASSPPQMPTGSPPKTCPGCSAGLKAWCSPICLPPR